MFEEKQAETSSISLPALGHLKKKTQNKDILINLIVQPGSRVRAFDDLKGSPEDVFPENTEAGKFLRNPEDALKLFSPPYTEEKTSDIFKQLAKLDRDIMGTDDFDEVLNAVNQAVNELPLDGPKSVKSAIEEMHLKEDMSDKSEEELRDFLKSAVEKDLRSAYRFKTLSSTNYYDTPAANGRVKDFAQGYNTSYRNDPEDEAACLQRLLQKATEELADRVKQLSVSSDGKSFASLESAAKDLISHKAFDRIGLEGAIQIITEELKNPKYANVENKQEFEKTVSNLYQLKIELNNTLNVEKTGEEEKFVERPGLEGLNEIKNSKAYMAIRDKSIANAILLEHVATLPSSTFRDELEFEISKDTLQQAFDNEIKSGQTAQQIIDKLYENKAYQALGPEAGSEILMTKINSIDDQKLKGELIADFDRRFDNAIRRELSTTVTAANANDQMERLLGDKHLPLIDQQKAHERILNHIAGMQNKEAKGALLNALNQQTNNQYAFPKSTIAKFFDKAVDWVKDIPNKMSKIGSKIKSFFNPPPKNNLDTSITTHPNAMISTPTLSEETKAEIAKRHKTVPISELKEKQEEVKDSAIETQTPLTEQEVKEQEKIYKVMEDQSKINRQTSETAFKQITAKCLQLAQSLKNSPLPNENKFKSDLVIALMQFDQLKSKVNNDLAEGKISKQTHQSLMSKIASIEMKAAKIEVVYDNLKKQGKSEEAKQDITHSMDGDKPKMTTQINGSSPQASASNVSNDSTLKNDTTVDHGPNDEQKSFTTPRSTN